MSDDDKIEIKLRAIPFLHELTRGAIELLGFLDDRYVDGVKSIIVNESNPIWQKKQGELLYLFNLAQTFANNGDVDGIEKPLNTKKMKQMKINYEIKALKEKTKRKKTKQDVLRLKELKERFESAKDYDFNDHFSKESLRAVSDLIYEDEKVWEDEERFNIEFVDDEKVVNYLKISHTLKFNIFGDIAGAYINLKWLKDMGPKDVRDFFGIEEVTNKEDIEKIMNDNTETVPTVEILQMEKQQQKIYPEVLSKEELKETKQFKRESDKLWMRTGRKYV